MNMRSGLWKCLAVVAMVAAGCGGSETAVDSVELKGLDEDLGTSAQGLTGCTANRATLRNSTGDLNMRSGPGTSYGIITVLPHNSTLISRQDCPDAATGWYKVYWGGTVGWASGSYLTLVRNSYSVRDEAIARAEGATTGASGTSGAAPKGFSYWWGGGAWKVGAAAGSCSGSCPSCTHSGTYGADCSGFVAKVWVVPSTNNNVTVNSHPYHTGDFHDTTGGGQWGTINRANSLKGDAFVYRSGGAGHIAIYESGDPWGSPRVHECKGCAAGCVRNSRSFGTEYKAIRRSGW
jgi:uncharacterized protein YraI